MKNIYEIVFVLDPHLNQEKKDQVIKLVEKLIVDWKGESLLVRSLGLRPFPQKPSKGPERGFFEHMIFEADSSFIQELERVLKIQESVLRFLTIKLGSSGEKEQILKAQDYLLTFKPQVEEKYNKGRKKTCWFTENKIQPDWKFPKTYSWLVSEFGKILPARMTGVSPKNHRRANDAIKRARMIGFISYVSNKTVESL